MSDTSSPYEFDTTITIETGDTTWTAPVFEALSAAASLLMCDEPLALRHQDGTPLLIYDGKFVQADPRYAKAVQLILASLSLVDAQEHLRVATA